MKRRELLQSLAAVTMYGHVVTANNGREEIANMAEVAQGSRYVVFYDPDVLDPRDVQSSANYLANATLFPIKLKSGQSIDDAVRIYELLEECPA